MKKTNKTILITGCSGKLGNSFIETLSQDPENKVVGICRTPSQTNKALRNYTELNIDLSSENASLELLKNLATENIYPNILVNNARNLDFLKINESGLVSRKNWMGEFLLDVCVPYELSMALAQMKNSQLNKIINISSIYGVVAPTPKLYKDFKRESPINYGVAKAALIHLSKELSVRLAPHIKVNTLSFGGVKGRASDEFLQRYQELCPSKDMLELNEVSGALEFLCSEKSSSISGHNLVVDGGWTVW